MIDLPYTLIIEATDEPDYFGFYSPELEGFSGIGHSVEDCLYKAKVRDERTCCALTRAQSSGAAEQSVSNRYDPK